MEKSEINRELEFISNQFKTMISDHFKSKDIEVSLESIDFSILHKTESENELTSLIEEKNLKISKTISRCRKNEQGQWVCT